MVISMLITLLSHYTWSQSRTNSCIRMNIFKRTFDLKQERKLQNKLPKFQKKRKEKNWKATVFVCAGRNKLKFVWKWPETLNHLNSFNCISAGWQWHRRQSFRLDGRWTHGSGQQDVPPQHPPALLQPQRSPRALLRLSLQTRPQRHKHGRLWAAHWRCADKQHNSPYAHKINNLMILIIFLLSLNR